jgi:hypothetical protein
MTWVSTGTETGWTDLVRGRGRGRGRGEGDDTQTHDRPFRLGCTFSFSLSNICFSEKLLIEGDGLLVEMEGESRGRNGLSDCGADLRRLSDRGCKGRAEAASTVGAGREWWFPMIGCCS